MTAMHTQTTSDWLADHGDYLYRFALARLRDSHQAEDVVQETMLAALQNNSFAGQSSPRTWLTGILKHKIIDVLRKQVREVSLGESADHGNDFLERPDMDEFFMEDGHWADKPQAWGKPDGELEQKQFFGVLQNCMEKLPKKLAAIFTLRDIEEEENEKICKDLEITTTNAWVMLYRARMTLRKCLELNWIGR
jgi:RNA polymerase sigma-70 factor (ECF subfamily)